MLIARNYMCKRTLISGINVDSFGMAMAEVSKSKLPNAVKRLEYILAHLFGTLFHNIFELFMIFFLGVVV